MGDTTANKSALPSGKFLLRIPRELHAALRDAAAREGLSLNDFCVRRLAMPAPLTHQPDLAAVVNRATELLGPALVGVIVFGSWARGEATAESDVDVLVVADAAFELTRRAYHAWDEQSLTMDGRRVEVHLVRLPAIPSGVTGLWAEAALDGIVLVERGLAVSTHLSAVRRAILSGRLERRVVHGQPYWTEVA